VASKETEDDARKTLIMKKTVYRFKNNHTGSAFTLWVQKVKLWAKQQEVMKKAARRWSLRTVTKCLNEWRTMVEERRILR